MLPRLAALGACIVLAVADTVRAQAGVNSRAVGRPVPASTDPRAELLMLGVSRIGPDRRIYVAERSHGDIRVFDSAGKHVANIGRKGEGPGEFRGVRNFGWVGDTLWVVDGQLRRFTLFDRALNPIRSFSTDVAGLRISPIEDVLTPGGRFVQASAPNYDVAPAPILKVSRDGKMLDTLARIAYGNALVQASVPSPAGNRASRFVLLQPFMDPPMWDIDPSGRWLAVANRTAPTSAAATRAEVRLYDLGTGTSRSFGLPYRPAPVTKANLDSVVKSFGNIPEAILRDVLYLPPFLPPIMSVVVSDDGGVWIQRQDAWKEGTWFRFDGQGQVTDVVKIPSAYIVVDARGKQLLASIREADDVQPPLMIYSIVK